MAGEGNITPRVGFFVLCLPKRSGWDGFMIYSGTRLWEAASGVERARLAQREIPDPSPHLGLHDPRLFLGSLSKLFELTMKCRFHEHIGGYLELREEKRQSVYCSVSLNVLCMDQKVTPCIAPSTHTLCSCPCSLKPIPDLNRTLIPSAVSCWPPLLWGHVTHRGDHTHATASHSLGGWSACH